MKPAAIGVRMHSGWGAVVTVSGAAGAVEIIDRRRIDVIDAETPGAKQPYHFARDLGLLEGEKHLARCAAASERLALAALREIIEELTARNYRVTGCTVVLASGRTLPPLAEILAAHPLIHTAEGEFFRETVRSACEHLGIKVTGIREREIEERAKSALGKPAAAAVTKRIANMGKALGPPWTLDHKKAALAAWMVVSKKA